MSKTDRPADDFDDSYLDELFDDDDIDQIGYINDYSDDRCPTCGDILDGDGYCNICDIDDDLDYLDY